MKILAIATAGLFTFASTMFVHFEKLNAPTPIVMATSSVPERPFGSNACHPLFWEEFKALTIQSQPAGVPYICWIIYTNKLYPLYQDYYQKAVAECREPLPDDAGMPHYDCQCLEYRLSQLQNQLGLLAFELYNCAGVQPAE